MEDQPEYHKKYRNPPSNFDRQRFRETKNLFVAIPLYLIRDEDIDGYSIALLTELLSYPEDWVINKIKVQQILKFPEKKFLSAWRLLTIKGYISRERIQGGIKWFITDNPNNIQDYKGNVAEDALEYIKKDILS